MARKLTKKQRGFVKDYLKTGNGTQAALKNYDTKDINTAAVIAVENLSKPKIVKSIEDALPEELLAERHLELLNKRDTYRWYEDVKDIDGKNVIDVIPHEIDLGVEVQAVTKGLDMAYKLKGKYAPEKTITLNVEVAPAEKVKALADKMNA